jgi:hypothetical protein
MPVGPDDGVAIEGASNRLDAARLVHEGIASEAAAGRPVPGRAAQSWDGSMAFASEILRAMTAAKERLASSGIRRDFRSHNVQMISFRSLLRARQRSAARRKRRVVNGLDGFGV